MQLKKALARILSPFQENLLKLFADLPESNYFYLTGGTALAAFYLGHRLSEDFDFFTAEERLVQNQGLRLTRSLEQKGYRVQVTRNFQSFFECVVAMGGESTRVQLAQDSPFRFTPPVPTIYGVLVDALEDIATNKLLALTGRFEPKDFFDIYFLVHGGFFNLETLIERSAQKDPGFDLYYLAIAFEKAKEFPDDQKLLPVQPLSRLDLPALKAYFTEQAIEMLKKSKKPKT